jgi:hypothetical protein
MPRLPRAMRLTKWARLDLNQRPTDYEAKPGVSWGVMEAMILALGGETRLQRLVCCGVERCGTCLHRVHTLADSRFCSIGGARSQAGETPACRPERA